MVRRKIDIAQDGTGHLEYHANLSDVHLPNVGTSNHALTNESEVAPSGTTILSGRSSVLSCGPNPGESRETLADDQLDLRGHSHTCAPADDAAKHEIELPPRNISMNGSRNEIHDDPRPLAAFDAGWEEYSDGSEETVNTGPGIPPGQQVEQRLYTEAQRLQHRCRVTVVSRNNGTSSINVIGEGYQPEQMGAEHIAVVGNAISTNNGAGSVNLVGNRGDPNEAILRALGI